MVVCQTDIFLAHDVESGPSHRLNGIRDIKKMDESERYDSRQVCLIIPPSPFLLDERVFVSLGVLKIAAVLEAQGLLVEVLDFSGVSNYLEALAYYLRNTQAVVIGLTATTPQLPSAIAIARAIRNEKPNIRLILGGPHTTLTYSAVKYEKSAGRQNNGRAHRAAAKLEAFFDVLCPGDGEFLVLRAVGDENCPKILDGDDHKSQYFMTDAAYENSPLPARHLVDLKSYHYEIDGHPATSLIGQLGCPFGCGFCGGRSSKSLRVIRSRSTESIIAEVEFLNKEYGFTGFMFYDDELNVSTSMIELMNGLSDLRDKLGQELQFRGFVKAELFTPEQGEAMRRAGFRWLLCGFESAAPRILTNIEKRASRDDNSRAVEIAKNNDLKIKALMSIGHPGESDETVQAIEDWLIEMAVDDFDCTIITTFPGTPYYDHATPHPQIDGVWTYKQPRTGDLLHATEVDYLTTSDYYKGDPDGGYKSYVFTDYLSSDDLVVLREGVERNVRARLAIPFNHSSPGVQFEHSMGQGFPENILKARPRI